MTNPSSGLPPTGRLAGIDYGERRIGISICDPNRILASPFENYQRRGERQDTEFFQRLVADEKIVGFVIGLPVYASGNESAKSLETRRFGTWLGQLTNIPVCYVDERYTTKHAEALLQDARLTSAKRKKRRDMLAAQLILTAYLESPQCANQPPAPLD
jgi:putative Holliday junction resolvase